MKKCIDEPGLLSSLATKYSTLEIEEIAIMNALKPGPAKITHYKLLSTATTASSTPSPDISAFPRTTVQEDYDTMVHNNKYLPRSLLDDSPGFLPDDITMYSMTPPVFSADEVDSQYNQMAIMNSVEERPKHETIMGLDRAYYEQQLLSVINKGLAYLTANPRH